MGLVTSNDGIQPGHSYHNEFYHTDVDKKFDKNVFSKVRMDAVSHLLEDSQLRDEPVSGETDDPLDWRSSFIFTIGKRIAGSRIVFLSGIWNTYTQTISQKQRRSLMS